ncbi:MAG TPA: M48 family metalloprotease [Phycisphaerae bacterium]|nr:M48 family metalloprotease [Phycisphaerae bacterium]
MGQELRKVQPGVPNVRIARWRRADWLYRLNRLLLYLTMLSYVPLILACVGGILYGAYSLTALLVRYWMGGVHAAWGAGVFLVDLFALGATLLLLCGLLPLFFREVDTLTPDHRLDLRQHPRLLALITRLCRRLDLSAPEACYLWPLDDTGIADLRVRSEDGRTTSKIRTLVLGAAFVVQTRIDEYATLVCHELAHAATGDTRVHKITKRFFTSLATQVAAFSENEPEERPGILQSLVYYLLLGYFHLFALLHEADARYRELRADRIAAEICGPQNVRNVLIKTHLVGQLDELSVSRLWQQFCERGQDIRNLYREHRRRWEQLPARRRQKAESEMFMQTTSVWHSHPCLAERVRNLADVETHELTAAAPATTLFCHWEVLEERMTQKLMTAGREQYQAWLRQLDIEARGGRGGPLADGDTPWIW